MGVMNNVAVIRQNSEDAADVQRILGLPDEAWSDAKVHFSVDEPALAEVTIILRGDQLVALAKIAHKRIDAGFMAREYPSDAV